MLRKVAVSMLISLFTLSSVDGIVFYDDTQYLFEIAHETDYGAYDQTYTQNDFELSLNVGYGYNNYTFQCEAFVYFPQPGGGYEEYPDNGDMGTSTLRILGLSTLHPTGTFTAKFHTTFFGWYNKDNDDFYDIVLVFKLDGKSSVYGNASASFTFYARAVMQGYGVYTIEQGTELFYPYDDHIVFGGERENGNVTETLDFSNTRDAICENAYLSINDLFEINYTPTSTNYRSTPKYIESSIYVYDPERYFEYMHNGGREYFPISLNCIDMTTDLMKNGELVKCYATFEVGNNDFWVEPESLVMSLKQETEYFKQTEKFFFKQGYYDLIKENCEFYLVASNVGWNEATYILQLDFLGNHDYFGNCQNSDFCVSSWRG